MIINIFSLLHSNNLSNWWLFHLWTMTQTQLIGFETSTCPLRLCFMTDKVSYCIASAKNNAKERTKHPNQIILSLWCNFIHMPYLWSIFLSILLVILSQQSIKKIELYNTTNQINFNFIFPYSFLERLSKVLFGTIKETFAN